ncbi:hypothetical protein RintRC_5904 [Richelia intracellularis]|nr:hypothetical protein RintRC_5904 [Richelia intracellularis]
MYIIVEYVLIVKCERQRPLGGTGGASPVPGTLVGGVA